MAAVTAIEGQGLAVPDPLDFPDVKSAQNTVKINKSLILGLTPKLFHE